MTNVAPPPDDGAQDSTRFAVVPVSVLEDTRLSDAATRLYAVLDGRITAKGSQRVRQDTLAGQLGWSRSKVQRVTGELARAGYIETRRTSRSSRIVLANPVRTGKPDTRQLDSDASNLTPQNARCVKSDAADASNLTPPQINILQGIKTNNNAGAEPTRQSAPAQPPVVEKTAAYLDAIKAATGHKIDATKTTQQRIAAIKAQGLTPDETATLVAAYLAAGNGAITNPPGFIAGHVLKSLAEGNKPEPPAVTPTPPSVAELGAVEPCDHGEPRGPSGCALCRNNEAGKEWASKKPSFNKALSILGADYFQGNPDHSYGDMGQWFDEESRHLDFVELNFTGSELERLHSVCIEGPENVERLARQWLDSTGISARVTTDSDPMDEHYHHVVLEINQGKVELDYILKQLPKLIEKWRAAPRARLAVAA